jgi:hypothetical protein
MLPPASFKDMPKQVVLIFPPNGGVKHLVDPASEHFGACVGPKDTTKRNSHIESWLDLSSHARSWLLHHLPLIADEGRVWDMDADMRELTNHFWADMLPVRGGVLGPFDTYEAARQAEIDWLVDHDLPTADATDATDATDG